MNDRYERHGRIPGWQQDQLSQATAIIIGVGALGNEVARLLALAGVGRLILCDPDRVESTNLSRTSLFRPADVGRLKVQAAAGALRELVPELRVEERPRKLVHGVGLAEIRDANIVIGGLDSRSARLQLTGRCALVNARLIDGATGPWSGEVRIFHGVGDACYGCSLGVHGRATVDVPWSCRDVLPEQPVGASAPMSALVGAWQAIFAVRQLMGLPVSGRHLSIDAERGITEGVTWDRDPACPLHQPLSRVAVVDAVNGDTVARLRAALGPDEQPLLWSPVQYRADCRRCGYHDERWRQPRVESCPRCAGQLFPQTTVELTKTPDQMSLAELGVPPREILPVRFPGGMRAVELRP
jgi:hypothetical protein